MYMSSPEAANDQLRALDAMERAEQAGLDGPLSQDLDVVAQRELAVRTVEMIRDVLEVDVSVDALKQLAADEEPGVVRLAAKRALRAVVEIGRDESEVVRRVGEASLYHYVEGVIDFGASERTYLGLMELYALTAEEATALYALRTGVAEQCYDEENRKPGFPALIKALETVGMSPAEAAADTDAALAAMQEAGFFVDHGPRTTYDRPKFWPDRTVLRLGRTVDSVSGLAEQEWLRSQLENNHYNADDTDPQE
jgi:hypothetical protein